MTNKTLADKAVDIKGKKYILVSDRILFLSEYGEPYSVITETTFHPSHEMWIVKATLTWNNGVYTGHAQEIIGDGYINKTSALENCETSAVGRACAMAGIGVIDSIASVDEIAKAKDREGYNNNVPDWDKDTFEKEADILNDLGVCAKCGAPNKKSAAGKIYCSKLCWKK